jgi:magnesium chelatase subunit H
MQYWLGGSDDNVEAMIRFLISRYARANDLARPRRRRRSIIPMSASTTPTCPDRITTDPADLPARRAPVAPSAC